MWEVVERAEHDDDLRAWEDRFNVMHGYTDNLLAACRGLYDRTGTIASDYTNGSTTFNSKCTTVTNTNHSHLQPTQ